MLPKRARRPSDSSPVCGVGGRACYPVAQSGGETTGLSECCTGVAAQPPSLGTLLSS
jgi:hypothetical protein